MFVASSLVLQVCDSYPQYLYVPASASPKILLGSAGFRSRGRFPVLSYLHPKTSVRTFRVVSVDLVALHFFL